ncbi:XRE family transcriptional regulator (plasmid) [Brevibacillus laterosporus]|uniref:XRE family transcriptional regulator n=1 Tax=Brevibacillus laterosporus TaxID=1465 RepID=A0A518V1X9_BRELA|nr:XRE family transcriptional regulator [Brevibacillus laterosporus]
MRIIAKQAFASFRVRKGYTQKKLAQRVKASLTHVSRVEKGQSFPSPVLAQTFCSELECTFDDIFFVKLYSKEDTVT